MTRSSNSSPGLSRPPEASQGTVQKARNSLDLTSMAVDEKTPGRPLDFEHDVIQRRPITTQTGLHTADATSPTPGVLANDDNIVFTSVTNLVNWARSRSPWPLGYGLACCAIEMMAASMSHHDTARFGAEVFRSSPRQADVMIVAGSGTHKVAPGPRLLAGASARPPLGLGV